MRGLILLFSIILLLTQTPAEAFIFKKKDYKQHFLQDALSAEKRNNSKQAFHLYEKALYYYKKDVNVIEAYAKFCERQNYLDRAEDLYAKAYVMTKDKKYLFKKDLCTIKNGKISESELKKIISDKTWSPNQKIELNKALIYHFSYKDDWKNTKKTCDQIPKSRLDKDIITSCIVASEKAKDKKEILGYYTRFSELYPNDSDIVSKIISLAEASGNSSLEEKYIKKLISQNPKDNGIKYRLAGFYERKKDWLKASKIYEGLMSLGDNSTHVQKSYSYVLSQLNPKKPSSEAKPPLFKAKPPSPFKIAEKDFYQAWGDKNYKKALLHLDKMLKEQPKNPKLLKHKVDILVSENMFQEALLIYQKYLSEKIPSKEDLIFSAFLYSKTDNSEKSLEIIESLLIKTPKNEVLNTLALQYSLSAKNWDKAIFYNEILLKNDQNNLILLKNGADLHSIKKEYQKAAQYYQKIVKLKPTLENKMELANLYMAGQNFENAQEILEPLYMKNLQNPKITQAYLNSLLAMQKTHEAYKVARDNNLMETKEGYSILGDLNLKNKKYETASLYYFKALQLDPKDTIIKNNLAFCYRMSGCLTGAANVYKEVLEQDYGNKEALLGLGSLQIDKKNYNGARQVFKNLLKKYPDYRPAKIALAHSYIASDEKLSALEILNSLQEDDEAKMMKAQIYYDFRMPDESKQKLRTLYDDDAKELKFKIKKDNAITITPSYLLFIQQLANEFNLDYQKYGLSVAKRTKNNSNVFMEYNVYWYTSGATYYLSNVVNEFIGGIQSRPSTKWEYRADLGVKSFQFGDGAMIITDSWLKHYFNDKFNLKLGFKRNNLEQSYVSAVGEYINGIFTGRVADTKIYLEYEGKLPKQFYTYGRGASGFMYGQNLPTNPYFEGLIGFGKLLYNNPKNKWVQTFAADIVSYNSSYRYNLLNLYDSVGTLYGGYFSPSYFNATTMQLKMEGNIKKWKLRYGLKGFGGVQTAVTPDQTTPTWGYSPYISYDINDNVTLNASYNHFDYADLKRDMFMFNLVIRGFNSHGKK